jgi:hypothetical protein
LERESEAEPFTQADMDDLVAAWKNLPNIDADTMLDPDEFPPTCQNYEVSAPQRDGGATGGSPSVVSAFTQWCTDMDGQTVSKTGVDTAFKMTAFSFYSSWLSANDWRGVPDYERCGDVATVRKDECIAAFNHAMITCDPNSGTTGGTAMAGQCIYYNITIDRKS